MPVGHDAWRAPVCAPIALTGVCGSATPGTTTLILAVVGVPVFAGVGVPVLPWLASSPTTHEIYRAPCAFTSAISADSASIVRFSSSMIACCSLTALMSM